MRGLLTPTPPRVHFAVVRLRIGNVFARVNRDQTALHGAPRTPLPTCSTRVASAPQNGFNCECSSELNWASAPLIINSSARFQVQPLDSNAHIFHVCLTSTDSSSTNTTENPSPSLSPPPSASKTSPLHSATSSYHLNTSNESDDDGQDCMDDDADDDNPDRPSDGGSPGMNGSMQSKRKKKTRTVFSRAQVFQLESTFDCKR